MVRYLQIILEKDFLHVDCLSMQMGPLRMDGHTNGTVPTDISRKGVQGFQEFSGRHGFRPRELV